MTENPVDPAVAPVDDSKSIISTIVAAKAEAGADAYLQVQRGSGICILWPTRDTTDKANALVELTLTPDQVTVLAATGACNEIMPAPAVYAVIDTETGGLFEDRHALLQVSVIIVDKDLNELDTFAHRIIPNPLFGIEARAIEVNGYDPAEWLRTGMPWDHADKAFSQYLKQWFGSRQACGVAHNAVFDEKFVRVHLPMTFNSILQPWFCTCDALKKWRKRTGNAGNAKLGSLAELAGYVHAGTDKAHDALGDTKACLAGLRWLLKQSQQVKVG
jgi:DNA polymerase III epsilon subunit-like protein